MPRSKNAVNGALDDTVQVTAAGYPQPQLADDQTLLAYLQTLLGPMPSAHIVRSTGARGIQATIVTWRANGRQTGEVSGLPETDVARAERWCRARVPEHVRDKLRVEVDISERHLTIVECRPPWHDDVRSDWTRFPVARLRYTKATRLWSLYWRDRNLRFHAYDLAAPTERIDDLLAEVDGDPTAIFWG